MFARRSPLAGVVLLAGLVVIVAATRELALATERAASMHLYGDDPWPDLMLNGGLVLAGAIAVPALLNGSKWGWWVTGVTAILGSAHATWLVVAPFGGVSYVPLLVLRGVLVAVLYRVRALF